MALFGILLYLHNTTNPVLVCVLIYRVVRKTQTTAACNGNVQQQRATAALQLSCPMHNGITYITSANSTQLFESSTAKHLPMPARQLLGNLSEQEASHKLQ